MTRKTHQKRISGTFLMPFLLVLWLAGISLHLQKKRTCDSKTQFFDAFYNQFKGRCVLVCFFYCTKNAGCQTFKNAADWCEDFHRVMIRTTTHLFTHAHCVAVRYNFCNLLLWIGANFICVVFFSFALICLAVHFVCARLHAFELFTLLCAEEKVVHAILFSELGKCNAKRWWELDS